MNYCQPNISIVVVWFDHGFSHCFLDTLTSTILLAFMATFGIGQLFMYRKHGTLVDVHLKPKNCLYNVQLFFHLIRLFLPFLWILLRYSKVIGPFYGHLVLKDVSELVVWTLALFLIRVERNYALPSTTNKCGHGIILLVFWTIQLFVENLSFISLHSGQWFWKVQNSPDVINLSIFSINYLTSLVVFLVGLKAPGLLTGGQRNQFTYNRMEQATEQTPTLGQRIPHSTFDNVVGKFRTLFPFIWPKNQLKLQLSVIGCVLLLIAGRVVNLYVPIFHRRIVDSLTSKDAEATHLVFRWDIILIYVALLLAQGGVSGGLLSVARSFLWIRIQQFSTREIQIFLYQHLHSLSLRWHLSRKTGEVLRVVDRGTNSVNTFLNLVLFNVTPTMVDIVIAIVYFTSAFNAWFGLIVFTTMAIYLTTTITVTEWRTKFRRNMNRLDNESESKAVDALLNFETVKYYNAEEYEVNRYRETLYKFQKAEWQSMASMSMLDLIQNCIITAGLLAGIMLCAWFVVQGTDGFTVGSYVLFASYIMQLYQPLNYMGTFYRQIQKNFVDMENMFDLLNEPLDIKDVDNAPALQVKQGRVEFNDVSFSYSSERPILKHVSFVVEPGKSLALVGQTGSGKSTIIRLLFRFYDITSGEITIDGQDISKVTQKSLRQHIGVVPQDTVLFNDTIGYNIRYGKNTASEEEVTTAAQAAEIHYKILSFTDGYDTMVGERGLKLSGGEKQRVAIARTILKAPNFVLLDEATSALDTHTERLIQASLDRICVGRTSITVAHRLSTIIHADEILVLQDGEIVERGTHESLIEMNNVYAGMWKLQLEKLQKSPNDFEDGSFTFEPATTRNVDV